ncbi:MAG TPA: FecR domain-containing protein [Pedobacter sp.]
MNNDIAKDLLEKYNAGTATEDEKAWVETWYMRFDDKVSAVPQHQVALDEAASWQIFTQQYYSTPKTRSGQWIAAAAVLLVALGTGLYFYTGSDSHAVKTAKVQYAGHIKPGGNKAVLTLANGKRISLTEAKNGQLAEQSGISITKRADGQLVYTAGKTGLSGSLAYNTIEIPRGGQYQLELPDGTRVWLNAASSLRYPTGFSGHERRVELKGEAYFEVAKNKAMPFHVSSGKQDVEVLGTHFNVNSYTDEKVIETTLLEGSVKVTDQFSHFVQVIRPGQQALLSPDHRIAVKEADVSKAVAWKNGDFSFRDDDLPYIMRQISRWYDVEVVYQGEIPVSKFAGQASRKITLGQMMDIIKASGIQVTLKGRTLFIKGSE